MPGRMITGERSHLPPQSVFVSVAAVAPTAPTETSIAAHRMREIALLILFFIFKTLSLKVF